VKLCIAIIVLLQCALALSATSLPLKKSSKTKVTKLPAFKAKKKITIDFDSSASEHTTTVVVRTPLPLDKAQEQQDEAAQNVTVIKHDEPKIVEHAQAPVLKSLPEVKVSVSRSAPTPFATPFATPSPAPIFINPTTVKTFAPTVSATPTAYSAYAATKAPVAPTGSTIEVVPVSVSRIPTPPPAPWLYADALRFYARTSYLNAHYSELESDLQNGATTMALGVAKQSDMFEIRGTLEFGHGLDQAVTPQNTRFIIARADAEYFFLSGPFSPIVGVGLGYADVDVKSLRTSDGTDTVYREHIKTSGVVISPSAGMRMNFSNYSLDLSAEYLTILGASHASALGGITGALGLGVPF
jgi:hypothetical protein